MGHAFTGRRMAAIMVLFFGTVIAVNFTMAYYASSTFGGIVVENSYVASQQFNRWLDEAAAEKAMGWNADAVRLNDGRISVIVHGPGPEGVLTGTARHPLGTLADRPLNFVRDAQGRFVSREVLPAGRWTLRLELLDHGRKWRTEEVLH